jgi:hypothetical protein
LTIASQRIERSSERMLVRGTYGRRCCRCRSCWIQHTCKQSLTTITTFLAKYVVGGCTMLQHRCTVCQIHAQYRSSFSVEVLWVAFRIPSTTNTLPTIIVNAHAFGVTAHRVPGVSRARPFLQSKFTRQAIERGVNCHRFPQVSPPSTSLYHHRTSTNPQSHCKSIQTLLPIDFHYRGISSDMYTMHSHLWIAPNEPVLHVATRKCQCAQPATQANSNHWIASNSIDATVIVWP